MGTGLGRVRGLVYNYRVRGLVYVQAGRVQGSAYNMLHGLGYRVYRV